MQSFNINIRLDDSIPQPWKLSTYLFLFEEFYVLKLTHTVNQTLFINDQRVDQPAKSSPTHCLILVRILPLVRHIYFSQLFFAIVSHAASKGEDRGADEVAAGAGPERQQGRPLSSSLISPRSIASLPSSSWLLYRFICALSSFRSPSPAGRGKRESFTTHTATPVYTTVTACERR